MEVLWERNRLVIRKGVQTLWLESWGENSIRVRMSLKPEMDRHDWALTEQVPYCPVEVLVEEEDTTDPWYRGEGVCPLSSDGKNLHPH